MYDEIDVAFVILTVPQGENWYNMVPFEQRDFDAIIGENVYKMGGSTGLTVGTLSRMSCDFECPTDRRVYRNCVQVRWSEGFRFAFHGDCGSIYCVRRGDAFVPIGIHRISGEGCSYGCQFNDAFEFLDVPDIRFSNPPYWRA